MVVLESHKSTQCGTAEFDVITNSLHCGKQIIGFSKEGSWLLRFLIAHSLRLPRLEVRHITVSKVSPLRSFHRESTSLGEHQAPIRPRHKIRDMALDGTDWTVTFSGYFSHSINLTVRMAS
jgi:hypothetical protein